MCRCKTVGSENIWEARGVQLSRHEVSICFITAEVLLRKHLLSAGLNSLLSFCKVPCFFNLGKQPIEVRLEEHLWHTKGS